MTSFPDHDPAPYALPRSLTARLLSPALVVYIDRVRANIRSILEHLACDANRWRPHVKTIKIPEVQAELARAGVRQFKCATTREADCLGAVLAAEAVQGDGLLAHPLLGPGLVRLAEIARSHPHVRYSVLVESAEVAASVPQDLGIFIDVNGGMNRTGIPITEVEKVEALAAAAGPRLRGLHAYDGDRHEADRASRTRELEQMYAQVARLIARLRSSGHSVDEVITAGTPAFLDASRTRAFAGFEGLIHRVSPGTVVLHDLRTAEENPDLALEPAALVFTRVVSHPALGKLTCDAGSKSVAADAGDPVAVVLGQPALVAQTPNEEHLPFLTPDGSVLDLGGELLLFPRHVCPTVNLAEKAVLIEDGQEPRVVAVEARAHEILLGKVSEIDAR